MLAKFKKNFSMIAIVSVILIAGIGGFYLISLKKGRYSSADLISISYKWGVGDTLVNEYQSSTEKYQYLDNRDSLIKLHLKLNSNNMIFLHSRANEIGLWDLPDTIANADADLQSKTVLRYEMEFRYKQKTKKIIYLTDYEANDSIDDAASKLQQLVAQTITDAENRTTVH